MKFSGLMVGLLAVIGCAEDLQPTAENQSTGNNGEFVEQDRVSHDDLGDRVVTVVDATDDSGPVYIELVDGHQIGVDDADSDAWHLSFQRFAITVNGGVSGPGEVAAKIIDDAEFDSIDQAPGGTYYTDIQGEPDDRGQNPGLVFQADGGWYDYDPATHTLTARDRVYILHLDGENFVKFQLLDYYDDAGTSGFVKFQWAPVEAPSGTIEIEGVDGEEPPLPEGFISVSSTDGEQWVYLSLIDREIVEVGDGSSDLSWDMAVSRTNWKLNGGVSGPGLAAARPIDETVIFDEVDSTSHFGFYSDAMLVPPHPPGADAAPANPALADWYDYDMSNHSLSPSEGVFVLRLADGSYGKFQILSYDDGNYALLFEPIDSHYESKSITVDASSHDDWIDLSLTHGAMVDAELAEYDWDLRVQRTRIAANGGTSGDRGVAAQFLEEVSFDEFEEAPNEGYEVDEELTVPGPSGDTYSGNSVLSDWFDYDMQTHQVSPKEGVFVVALADGGYAALTIDDYDDGVFELRLAYTGPERTAF